jgi:hypothetical protein
MGEIMKIAYRKTSVGYFVTMHQSVDEITSSLSSQPEQPAWQPEQQPGQPGRKTFSSAQGQEPEQAQGQEPELPVFCSQQ